MIVSAYQPSSTAAAVPLPQGEGEEALSPTTPNLSDNGRFRSIRDFYIRKRFGKDGILWKWEDRAMMGLIMAMVWQPWMPKWHSL